LTAGKTAKEMKMKRNKGTIGRFDVKEAKIMKRYFWSMAMLFTAIGAFAQEVTISSWGYGLEASMGVISGNELPNNYSISFQGLHDYGSGLSLDYIHGPELANSGGLLVNSGFLGSAFLGLPLSKYFIPYVGGGLGVKFNDIDDDIGFAWKVDGGVAAWLSDILYIKAGAMYDNIRKDLGVSVGVGFKLTKTVSATYRDYNGTFRRTFTKNLWENNSTPNNVYEDKLVSSEVIRTYQKNTSTSSYTPAQYEFKTSGGETFTTTYQDQYGRTTGTATTRTPTKDEYVKTREAEMTTRTYLWNVTVTRHWYTRTYYYKDREPTTTRFYQDTESGVQVNSWTETERR
jgi:ribosomal protein L19E